MFPIKINYGVLMITNPKYWRLMSDYDECQHMSAWY